jgi:methyl-accepting chemotaxis protein
MEKTSKAVDSIAGNFNDMKRLENRQKEGAEKSDKAVEHIKASINSLNKSVEDQAENINSSSSAIEEMTANIESVTRTLVENVKNVDALMEASEHGKAGLQSVVEKIQEIARDSEGLLEINSVMESIASQTNLLSMTAAIEAAQAGESGKGFAVVAAEIRKLAESSSQQSNTTAAMLKKIKASIDSITKASQEVQERFSAIDTRVKTVSEHELNIRNAMEEQEVGGRQILQSVGRLKDISVTVKTGTKNVDESSGDLIKETGEFIKISDELIDGMNEIVSGAMSEIQAAVKHVNKMSEENNKNFIDLKEETEKFTVSAGMEKKKILLVDDDATVLAATRGKLMDDYDIITAKSGDNALSLFYRGLVPNLILLDLKMPGMDGWDTFERIKAIGNLHAVPIAIFTSSTNPEDKVQAQKIGAVDFIQKSVEKNELLERIGRLIKN